MKKGEGIYNVVVIGAGTAGLVTAAGTAGLGGRVALIERNKMGGDCLNFGCVPSKALISSARALHTIGRAAAWGIDAAAPEIDFKRIVERVRERRAKIAPNDSQERFESLGVDVFRGEARFLSAQEVAVDGVKLRAKHFVIATGTHAARPKIDGLDSVKFFTNETIFDELDEKPERLLVLGGGPIGCELAQSFARLGIRVTLVQHGPRILSKEDPEVSTLLRATLESDGIEVLTDSELASLKGSGSRSGTASIASGGATREMKFDALLLAAGRQPNLDALNLDAAGVRANKHAVEVNEFLQTSQPHIYAAGDITGRHLFTHMADYDARVVVRNILMPLQLLRQRANTKIVPWATYTDPEVARVGLSEEEAKKQGVGYDVYRQEMADVDRAIAESAMSGFAKVLTARGTDRILGALVVGEHAGDLLQPLTLAMNSGIGLSKVAAAIHPYPTFVEIERKTGDAYNKTKLTPRAKKIFSWLYARQRG